MMEKQLNPKLKEGDAGSFSELFKQTHPRLLGYCQLFVKDRKDAEDLVQECFFQLWQNRQKIDPNKSVESLLFVSLRNRCLNYLKENSRYAFDSLDEGFVPNEIQYLYQIDFTDKKEMPLEEQLVEALKKAIDELPERKREILIKSKIEGRKQKEIAEELGISIKTVEKHLRESKLELRQKLEKQFASLSVILYLMLQ
jgi:RNA polymerase sigma-70 factor (ECF subfamily)